MAQTIKLKRSGTSGRLPTTSDLELGEVAINTYDGKMYIKKNVGGTESIVEIGGQGGGIASSFTLYEYTATSGQTTFSGSDGNSNTLAYDTGTPPKILVYLNGVLLDHTTDYTATNGTSVVLTSAAAASDLVQIAAYESSVSTTLDIDLADNQKLLLGDDDDLELYHSGTHSYIRDSGTGRLYITTNNLRVTNAQGNETLLDAYENGRVDLYYDNSKKLETTSTGVDVTGDVLATSFTLENGGDRSLTGPQNEDLLINARPNDAAEGLHLQINGADKLLINQAGNVGIGTSSPGSFHANASNLVVGSGSGTEGITINSGTANYGVIYFADGTSGSAAYAGNINYNHSDNSMRFGTAGSTTSVVIDSSGDVGIGTSSPEDRLHISGGNLLLNNALEIRTKDTGGNLRTVLRANSSNELEYGWSANAPVKFMGGGSYTERMRIHTNGNIGINETSPAGSLHISNAAQASLVLQGDTANSGDSGEIDAAIYMLMDKGAGNDPFGGTTHGAHGFRLSTENHSGASAFRIDDWDSGSYLSRMYINTSGDVGIGTTSPGGPLHVKSSTNKTIIADATFSSGSLTSLAFQRNSTDKWRILQQHNDSHLSFYNDATSAYQFSLKSDGNVGIGTTSPYYQTHLSFTDNTTALSGGSSGNWGGNGLRIENASTTAGAMSILHFRVSSADWHIGNRYISSTPDKSDFFFKHENTEVLTILNDGSVGIGTTAPSYLLHVDATVSTDPSYIVASSGTNFVVAMGSQNSAGVGQEAFVGTLSNDDLKIKSNNTERIRVKADGKVGIGTPSPSSLLHLKDIADVVLILEADSNNSGETDNARIELRQDGNNVAGYLYTEGNAGQTATGTLANTTVIESKGAGNDVGIHFATGGRAPAQSGGETNGTVRMTVHGSGGVTIGTTSTTNNGGLLVDNDIKTNSRLGIGSAGNTSTPALYNNSDTDTGVYWPSANALGFVTGGVERVRISSSGNVALTGTLEGPATFTIDPAAVGDNTGTVVIAGNLQVDGTTTTINSTTLTVDDKNITLASGSTNAAAANGAGITVDCGSDTDATFTYVSATDDWKFDKPTRVSGLTNGGIAFTSTETLVDGSSSLPNGRIFYHSSRLIYDSPSSGHRFAVAGNQGSNLALEIYSNRDIGFYNSSGAADLFWDASTSRLGIGTTSPLDHLHLNSSSGDVRQLLNAPTGSDAEIKFSENGTVKYTIGHDAGSSNFVIGTTNVDTEERFVINTSGHVGIGTEDPAFRFHTYHPTTNVVARFESGDGQVWIDLHDSNSGTYGCLLGAEPGNDKLFVIADQGVNRRFIIDNAGQVGIGNNIDPVARLQVEELGIDTTTTTTSATTQAVIDTMAAATFRSAKYTIQVTNTTDSTYHLTEILLIHDGTTPRITEYGTIFTSSTEATFDADISSGNVRLLATPATTDSMTFKVVRHCITV